MKQTAVVVKFIAREKKDTLLSVLFGFLAGIGAVSLFANSGYLISKAAVAPPLYVLTVSIALLKLFSVTRALSRYGERYFSHRATFTILSNLRSHFFERLEPMAPRIFYKFRSGDLLARITGDVETLQHYFLRVFYPPVVMVIVFLATILFTVYFSAEVAVVLVAGLILTGVVLPGWFALRQHHVEKKVREKRGGLSTETAEFLYGFQDLKIHQRLANKERELLEASQEYVTAQEKEGMRSQFSQSVNEGATMVVSWFVLGLGAYLVASGDLEGVFLAMLVMVSLTVFENAVPMAAFPYHFEDSRQAGGRLAAVTGYEEEPEETDKKQLRMMQQGRAWAADFSDVSFAYPGEGRSTLKSINVTVQAGSKTAVIGPSGSGKSTLLQLMLKVFQPDEGTVQIDGISTGDINEQSLWTGINTMLQEPHFFYGTVRENLELAGDHVTDDSMKEALGHVKLETFSLDDTVLEKGGNLSGGERQRLAIARALLKGGRLWLLDEPTSSVDAVTEKIIYDRIFHEAAEETVILVSHRLTGLETMDQIIVMDEGKVAESGTYEELMAQKGYFYRMKEIEKDVFSA